jgi:predicted nucleic acid-binding protein
MANILIDSDVILDILLDRKPFSDNASIILARCESGEIKGFITPVILSNIYYILCRNSKHEKVISSLKILVNILEIAIIDKTSVLKALNSDFKDFEDALQNFSAETAEDIKIIITRNLKDYKKSNLSIMTPDNYLESIARS